MDVAPRAGLRPFDTRSDFGAVRHGNLPLDTVRGMYHRVWLSGKAPHYGERHSLALCFHEPELFQAGQQPVVPNLSGRPGELLHRVQRGYSARRYDGTPAFCPARRLKHNFIQEVVYEYHTAPLGGGSPIQEQSAKE